MNAEAKAMIRNAATDEAHQIMARLRSEATDIAMEHEESPALVLTELLRTVTRELDRIRPKQR